MSERLIDKINQINDEWGHRVNYKENSIIISSIKRKERWSVNIMVDKIDLNNPKTLQKLLYIIANQKFSIDSIEFREKELIEDRLPWCKLNIADKKYHDSIDLHLRSFTYFTNGSIKPNLIEDLFNLYTKNQEVKK